MTDATQSDSTQLQAMLAGVARGDRGAFEQLYRSTSAKLFGICLRILPQRGDAEDVLQDVFTSVWRKAGSYDPALASPITWLGMMARHRAIDKLRAGRPERDAAPIDLAGDVVDAAPLVDAAAEQSQERQRLEDCMDKLESRRRTLIRTAFFDGATYEELSARSGSPLGSVKSWIRRGLAQLKACLER